MESTNSNENTSNNMINLPLTKREKEILIQIAKGFTNKEISESMFLSFSTVRNHISSIFTKLKITNRSQATALAIYAGLVNPLEELGKFSKIA